MIGRFCPGTAPHPRHGNPVGDSAPFTDQDGARLELTGRLSRYWPSAPHLFCDPRQELACGEAEAAKDALLHSIRNRAYQQIPAEAAGRRGFVKDLPVGSPLVESERCEKSEFRR